MEWSGVISIKRASPMYLSGVVDLAGVESSIKVIPEHAVTINHSL